MPVILYCRLCDIGYGSVGDLPVRCPNCGQVTRWGTSPPHSQNRPDWMLSENDRRLLHAAKIDPA